MDLNLYITLPFVFTLLVTMLYRDGGSSDNLAVVDEVNYSVIFIPFFLLTHTRQFRLHTDLFLNTLHIHAGT